MTAQETKEALLRISEKYGEGIDEKLAALSSEAKNERGVLKMMQNMVGHCGMFVNIAFGGGERYFAVREKRVFRDLALFKPCREAWEKLEEEQRKCYLIYSFAFAMVYYNFYLPHRKELAPETRAADRMKAEILCRLIGDILRDWQKWWKENGCLPCEVEI